MANLHSTVVLLKANTVKDIYQSFLNLHSTVVLLKEYSRFLPGEIRKSFTFYCSSIKSSSLSP